MDNSSANQSSQSSSFLLLDERIQRWIWQAGWTELRDAQEKAVEPILAGDRDLIIAAATAAGKTEAAFLPILTKLLRKSNKSFVLYVSPLKALINDQWDRLEKLCSTLEIPVVPWHGDISASKKKNFLKDPRGVLLITPESLESMLMNRMSSLGTDLSGLLYVVVDELHAFIGTERGKQLQSLLDRIDCLLNKNVPRIGLSATLGDMGLAAEFLRPNKKGSAELIISKDATTELKVLIKGYVNKDPIIQDGKVQAEEEIISGCEHQVTQDLFSALRGTNNLVFPNSRADVEFYADRLRKLSEENSVPNEFWPHHGNLSKDIRQETEVALKSGERPATAVCTSTLELGIDIGAIKTVAQIGPAPSVASLRQRMGRSGRRKGDAAILRCYCVEEELARNSSVSDLLREGLVQTIAQIRLLVQRWYEPPVTSGLHLSTFIQQVLSLIAQYGGRTAVELWNMLVLSGPFKSFAQEDFTALLRHLGKLEILMQDASGLLLHGTRGEALVNHYSFYAAFATPEEYRLVTSGKSLGTLPVSSPLTEGDHIIFAGRRWRITLVDEEAKVISVVSNPGGKVPRFTSSGGNIHTRVREEMLRILMEDTALSYLDVTASRLLSEARENFKQLGLHGGCKMIAQSKSVQIIPWVGDDIMYTLLFALRFKGLDIYKEGICLYVYNSREEVKKILESFRSGGFPNVRQLAEAVLNKHQEKWDYLLPEDLLGKNFISHKLNVEGAKALARDLADLN